MDSEYIEQMRGSEPERACAMDVKNPVQHIRYLIVNRTVDNPIYSKQIEKIVNVSDVVIRRAVREMRREGRWIANCTGRFKPEDRKNSKGYFLAKDWSEIEPTITDLTSRRNSLTETIEAMTHTKNDLFI